MTRYENYTAEEQKLNQALDHLFTYDFTPEKLEHLSNLNDPVYGGVLPTEVFEQSGLNHDVLDYVKKCVDAGVIPVISGAFHSGKSSIGRVWTDADEEGRVFAECGAGFDYAISAAQQEAVTGVFIDEFTPSAQNIKSVTDLKSAHKGLILSTSLENVEPVIDQLQAEGIQVVPVIIKPLSEEETIGYIAQTLKLDMTDNLAVGIAKLSGGSPLIAAALCQTLIDEAIEVVSNEEFSSNEEFAKKVLRSGRQKALHWMEDWKTQRETCPQELKNYIPHTLLEVI